MSLYQKKINWRSLIINTIRLDIYDLNAINSNQAMRYYDLLPQSQLPRKGIVARMASFYVNMYKSFVTCLQTQRLDDLLECEQMAFVTTRNQKEAIRSVISFSGDTHCYGIHGHGDISFDLFKAYLLAIPFFPLVMYHYFKSDDYRRLSFKYSLDLYWLSYGLYIYGVMFFLSRKYCQLIVSNDHLVHTRTLVKCAHDCGVSSIYIQHASVSSIYPFPNLNFTYALLEGMDSVIKYDSYGPSNSRVFLIGNPKFDTYFSLISSRKSVKTVGVAFNLLDNEEKVQQLLNQLRSVKEWRLIVRPHPGDNRFERLQSNFHSSEIVFSNARKQSSIDFLANLDVLIAGDSNIVLESILLNVYTIRFGLADNFTDQYGFVQNGLIEYFSKEEMLIDRLLHLHPADMQVRSQAKKYCFTVDTEFDGKSGLITSLVFEAIRKRDFSEFTCHETGLKNIKTINLPKMKL